MAFVLELIGALIGLTAVFMALAIPLSWSPVGRALADAIRARTDKVRAVHESRIQALEAELHQIRELLVLGSGTPPGKTLDPPEASAPPHARRQAE